MTEVLVKTEQKQEAAEILNLLDSMDEGQKREFMGFIRGAQLMQRLNGRDDGGDKKETA